ncbi:DUF4349 domain-containing protein [Halanaerobaculum tunisiense]
MNRKIILTILLALLLIFTVACQENNNYDQAAQPTVAQEQLASKSKPQPTQQDTPDKTRQVIKTATIRLEQQTLTATEKKVRQLVNNHNGYITSSRQDNNNKQKFLHYEIKVPHEQLTTVISKIEDLGYLQSKQLRSRDVTKEYIDLQARLKNFKAQEKKYLQLLDKTEKVAEILKVEKELNRIRQNIEQLQGRLNYYNNQVKLSTINLHISQPEPILTQQLGTRLITSLQRAVQGFINSINSIIIFIGSLIPWASFLVLLSWIGYKIYTRLRQ